MLSKNRLKYIRSLRIKKYRDEHRQFVVEGDKIILGLLREELIPGSHFLSGKADRSGQDLLQVRQLIATSAWLEKNSLRNAERIKEITEVSEREYKQITMLESPSGVMALLDMPRQRDAQDISLSGISLVLEMIQDPGNLGAIIRTASWFGIKAIYCSPDSVDCFNPKVVQSSMGAILHTPVFYSPLAVLLKRYGEKAGGNVYGTFLAGSSVWEAKLNENAVIVLGNESRGISEDLLPYIPEHLHIPGYRNIEKGEMSGSMDSLNVAAAAAIVCAAFRMPSHC